MTKKLWQIEDVRNHLSAVRSSVKAGRSAVSPQNQDERLVAYYQGCEAVIDFLANRFGVDLVERQTPQRSPTGELRLKTWVREDIEQDLRVAWLIMSGGPPFDESLAARQESYHQGIRHTLYHVAMSFGIENLT